MMIENGTIEADINALLAKANEIQAINTAQETNKANRPIQTEAELQAYNAIYDKVLSVSKMASRFYTGNATHQSLFSFSKISKTINASPKRASAPK